MGLETSHGLEVICSDLSLEKTFDCRVESGWWWVRVGEGTGTRESRKKLLKWIARHMWQLDLEKPVMERSGHVLEALGEESWNLLTRDREGSWLPPPFSWTLFTEARKGEVEGGREMT